MLPGMTSMSSTLPILVITGTLLVAASVFLWMRRREQERTEAMRRFARTRGFEFRETVDRPGPDTWLFKRGRRRRVRNVLTRSEPDGELTLLDYRYHEHHGNHSHREQQTVVMFRRPGRPLPAFELRPENLFHKVAAVFGFRDIDFENRPDFSGKYLLRGPDERAVRELFGPSVLGLFEKNPGWSAESDGEVLVVYRGGKTAKPDDLPEFLEDTKRVFTTLTSPRG